MDRIQLKNYIESVYGANEERPWQTTPESAIYRHRENKKWFAAVMNIPKNKLDGVSVEKVEVLNVKCEPMLIGTLTCERGVYPAYHMSKTTWITIILSEVSDDKIKWLLDMSYETTLPKPPKKHNPQ